MRFKHFLLSLALVSSLWGQASSDLQDCVPVTLRVAAGGVGYDTTEQDWIEACGTTNLGTDIDRIIPAWNDVTVGSSKLVPIYVVPRIGLIAIDAKFEGFRRIADTKRGIEFEGRVYVWVGLHRDLTDKTMYYNHCALVAFYSDHVVLISPNSAGPAGIFLEVKLSYPEFFKQTFLVLEIFPQEPPPNQNHRHLISL